MYYKLCALSGVLWILFITAGQGFLGLTFSAVVVYLAGALIGILVGKLYLPVYSSKSSLLKIFAPVISLAVAAFTFSILMGIYSLFTKEFLVDGQGYEYYLAKILEYLIVSLISCVFAIFFYPLAFLNHYLLKRSAINFISEKSLASKI